MGIKATILTSTPPVKGISKYSTAFIESLADMHDTEVISFKSMYPNFLYPGGTKDDSLRPLKESRHIRLRNFLTWYNPFGWLYAGLTVRGEILHVQWWTYVLAPIYVVILLGAKTIRRKKVVITIHNVKPHESGFLKKIANRIVIAFGDYFIVHTEEGRRDFMREYKKPAKKVGVIPHGILLPDTGIKGISKMEAREKLGIHKDKKVLLFFGIIREYKGLDTLMDALAIVKKSEPNALLVIAGKPWENWEKYESRINELGLTENIKADLGFIPEDDIEAYFQAADLAVFPYRQFDAQSGAGTLALPFGKAMIVTNTGGLPSLVDDDRAIVPPEDASKLASVITQVLSDEELRKKLEKDSLRIAKGLSWETIAKQTTDTYDILKKS